MLLSQAIQLFETYLITTEKSRKTIKSYISDMTCINHYLDKKYNCPVYVEDVTTDDFEAYLLFRKEKGDCAATRRKLVYTFRSFSNFAQKKGFISQNAATRLDVIPVQHKERETINDDEFQYLMNAIDHPLTRVVVATMFFTGLRINECLSLLLSDVDFSASSLLVRNTKSRKDRRVPINGKLAPILMDYVDSYRSSLDGEIFFASKKSGKLSAAYINRKIYEATVRLGWKKHISCHNLRHSFASNLLRNKVDLVRIQKLLGHSSLTVTSVYTHTNYDELKEAVNKL